MDKYYTPSIEEFHVGFEYEYKSDQMFCYFEDSKGKWKKTTFIGGSGADDEPSEIECIESSLQYEYKRYGDVRAKYLDKEDIESLGWKPVGGKLMKNVEDTFELPYKDPRGIHDTVQLIFNYRDLWCLICTGDYKTTHRDWESRFCGHIKNKSRLKLVMEMVGI